MKLIELLEQAGIDLYDTDIADDYVDELNQEIEVHYQPNYPLKTGIANIKQMDGKLVFALEESDMGYGSKKAWEEDY